MSNFAYDSDFTSDYECSECGDQWSNSTRSPFTNRGSTPPVISLITPNNVGGRYIFDYEFYRMDMSCDLGAS